MIKQWEVCEIILKKMEGQNAFQYSFQKNDQLETLGVKVTHTKGEAVSVDPQLLFQKLLIIANNTDCNLDELFQ